MEATSPAGCSHGRFPDPESDRFSLFWNAAYTDYALHSANSMFLARRSRTIGGFSGAENRRWLARPLATTMAKSQHLSEEVYLAMLSRGYQGEIYVLNPLKFKIRDSIWAAAALIAAALLLWRNYR